MTSSGYLQTRMAAAFIGCLAAVGSLGAGEPSPKILRAAYVTLTPRRGATREACNACAKGGCRPAALILGLPA